MHTLLGLETFPIDDGATTSSGFGLRVLSTVRDVSESLDEEVALSRWDEIVERLETDRVVGYDEASGKLLLGRE